MKVKLIATSAFGLEALVANEIKQLGGQDVQVQNGRVDFTAEAKDIARYNLWLRCADRLLLKAGEFKARSFDQLFEGTRKLNWPDFLPENARFPVEGKSVQSQLYSVSDCQAIVKKAIVEKLKTRYSQSWFEESGPLYRIQVSILKDIVTLSIDTSGAGLHKRGYRQLSSPAPLKETLAAAMVILSRWKADRPFIDPFCGSGTIPIEAALIGKNIAPGINRRFVAEEWNQLPSLIWSRAREEAHDLIIKKQQLGIIGYDIDNSVLQMARFHTSKAGLGKELHWQRQDVRQVRSRYSYGYVVSNPPYGERLGKQEEIEKLYRDTGRALQEALPTWSYYFLSPQPGFEKLFGRRADKNRKLYNGRIECRYYQFFGPKPDKLQGPFTLHQPV
ncbi:MAG TPA: class I SAM-dependent RNA methyltransferase [Syntrophomonadaceae bacterium]|nr:class I SAM-dependent RNA methyltransferase [Syntrophomonadaceae bacterium]